MSRMGNILVAEDEALVAEDIQQLLKQAGYGISKVVTSGREAEVEALEGNADVVVMDIMLDNGIDGVEAARRIREKSDIPIIYLTGYSDAELIRRAAETRPSAYLLKPFHDRELSVAVDLAMHSGGAGKSSRAMKLRKARLQITQFERGLRSLFEISRGFLAESDRASLLQRIADLLPRAFRFPVIAASRIVLDEEEYFTADFVDSQPKVMVPLDLAGRRRGRIEVVYLDEQDWGGDYPFTAEERLLVGSVAGFLSGFLAASEGREFALDESDDIPANRSDTAAAGEIDLKSRSRSRAPGERCKGKSGSGGRETDSGGRDTASDERDMPHV